MPRLRYLVTSEPGLRWLRAYYRRNPQLDLSRMVAALRKAEGMLRDFPQAGHRFEDYEDVRELGVEGTAFSLLYTVSANAIWIIDVRDRRGYRSAEALRDFNRELRKRMERDARKRGPEVD